VTRERIRQIEAQALLKLRRLPGSEGLRALLNTF
jgi:DNA-directed RNA polymerase sigma subunit (sigma70/sigma32)